MERTWRPFTLAWDDNLPLDLSFVFADEKPAGKRGFVGVDGSHMVFADGTEARFWGTCFNSGANFPSHADSEMLARRLAKLGINIMRTHQMDSEWASPNIFQFNRFQPKDNTRSLDPESMERLDYLIYCLKQQGVYVYLDLLTYRQFRPCDGVDAVDQLPQAAKPYLYFDPRLIQLQQDFNRDLWLHTNPYTKLAYKDDPAIAMCELVNEADLFAQPPVLEPYRTRLEQRYRAWAEAEGVSLPPDKIDFTARTPAMGRFFVEVQAGYYRQMIAHLRDVGVRVPIAGTNWSINFGVLQSQKAGDFTDGHVYWNFPTWEHPNGCQTKPMVRCADNVFHWLSFERLLDRPYFVSEWDHAWPDEWRAESPLLYAAVAAFQGWTGATIHTYRYSTRGPVDSISGGASTINGIPYRNHFDAFNDPAKFGLFYQAALILRRGDVSPAKQSLAVTVPASQEGWELLPPTKAPAFVAISEQHRVGSLLPGDTTAADATVPFDRSPIPEEAGSVTSDTGELHHDWQRGFGTIDTPRTKAAYGFLGEVGRLELDGLTLEVETDFATVALSSLTDDATAQSDTLLLTAVGRCQNTGERYDEARTRQLDRGHAPVLIEPIVARVTLRTERPNLKVWVVSDKGEVVTRLPAEYKDGALTFAIGLQPDYNPSTIYYLIRI